MGHHQNEKLTKKLSEFAFDFSYDDLPSEVKEQAKLFILDTLGCALGGRTQAKEEVSWITMFAGSQNSKGNSTIFGEKERTSAATAALANGAIAHTIDFDAGAKLLKLDSTQIEMTIGLAADAAGGLRYGVDNGDFSKSLHPAMAAMKAVLFAQLINNGATGPLGILEYSSGFFNAFSEEPNFEPLLDRLGEYYEISVGGLKSFPTIQCSHTAISKTLELVKENGLKKDDIAEVSIIQSETMPGQGMNYTPKSPLAARLSTPFAVSLGLQDGAVSLERFTEDTLADPEINEIMSRIKIDSSTQLAEEHPNTVASIVDIKTQDGRKFSGKQIFAKGDPNNRMTSGEIQEKFHKLSLPVLGMNKAGQVAKKIINLEEIRDLDEITQMLR